MIVQKCGRRVLHHQHKTGKDEPLRFFDVVADPTKPVGRNPGVEDQVRAYRLEIEIGTPGDH